MSKIFYIYIYLLDKIKEVQSTTKDVLMINNIYQKTFFLNISINYNIHNTKLEVEEKIMRR